MNLRNRSLLVLGVTFFAFFIIIAAVSLSVTLSGLDRIEYQDMADSMNQTRAALAAESGSLLNTAQDWGSWDEMYQFSADHNPAFIAGNAQPDALATLHLNLFLILDFQGNLLYGKTLSPDYQASGPVPADLEARVASALVPGHPPSEKGTSGLYLSPDGPMIIAAVPILRSDSTGPVHGTVVMGRYLEPEPLRRISSMTGFDVSFHGPEGNSGGALSPASPSLPEQESLTVVAENASWVTGYTTIRDITGREMTIAIAKERQLHRIGFANIVTYLILLALWAVMTGLIVAVVMDRTVLQRLGRLTEHVRTLAENREDVPAPVLTGNDELTALEKTILASRAALVVRERQLRSFVFAMPGPAGLFTREGKILLANPAFTRVLKGSGEDVTGTLIQSYFPPGDMEKFEMYVQEAIRRKGVVHFENETGGKTYLMSYYPVLDNNGEVVQLGFLSFDISERKRLENALQKLTKKIALLNTVIFSDIQNKVFVQMGYLELAKNQAADPGLKGYLEKEEGVIREIQSSLRFAKQYNDMGMSPPRWQNVLEVMLFAVSHLDLGALTRDFHLEGLEIYADSLLERVFVTMVENTLIHAKGATVIRAGFAVGDENAVIFVEDDGSGVPEERKEEIFRKGIGSAGSSSLFLSREILSITGITIREIGVPGKGARFEIAVPKGSFRVAGK